MTAHQKELPNSAFVALGVALCAILGTACGGGSSPPSEPPLALTRCCSTIFVQREGGTSMPLTEGEQPKWSPDHRTLVFTRADYEAVPGPTNDIWTIAADGTGLRRLTSVPAPDQVRLIAFGGDPPIIAFADDTGIWTMNPDGSEMREVLKDGGNANELAISPDGLMIAYASNGTRRSPPALRLVDTNGQTRRTAFQGTEHTCGTASPTWSPDSRWLAFSLCTNKGAFNNELGIWLVHPNGSDLHRIVAAGGYPTWSPDGDWIAFTTSRLSPKNGVLTAVARIHPDGSGRELLTPYQADGSAPGPVEALDW